MRNCFGMARDPQGLGDDYDEKVIVGDSNLGQLYAFPLNVGRIEGPEPAPIPVPGLPVASIVMLGLLLGGAAAIVLGRRPAPYARG